MTNTADGTKWFPPGHDCGIDSVRADSSHRLSEVEKGEYCIVLNDGEIVCAAKTKIEARQLANCLNQSDKVTSPDVSAGALNYLRELRGLHHLSSDMIVTQRAGWLLLAAAIPEDSGAKFPTQHFDKAGTEEMRCVSASESALLDRRPGTAIAERCIVTERAACGFGATNHRCCAVFQDRLGNALRLAENAVALGEFAPKQAATEYVSKPGIRAKQISAATNL